MTDRRGPQRLRLGIDLDGVVADFNAGWISRYNGDFGADLLPEHVDIWDAPTLLTHFTDMGEFWTWARTSGDGASIFRILEPYHGAIEALDRLAELHHVVIVTTKPSYASADTFSWIGQHGLPTTEVHIIDDKTMVDCDVYLDDGDHNLEALVVARPEATVCRYVQPWNRNHDGVVDVSTWQQFGEIVDGVRITRCS